MGLKMKPQEALTFFLRINRANSLTELRKINPGFFLKKSAPVFILPNKKDHQFSDTSI